MYAGRREFTLEVLALSAVNDCSESSNLVYFLFSIPVINDFTVSCNTCQVYEFILLLCVSLYFISMQVKVLQYCANIH